MWHGVAWMRGDRHQLIRDSKTNMNVHVSLGNPEDVKNVSSP